MKMKVFLWIMVGGFICYFTSPAFSQGLGMIKEQTRPNPGWVCTSHPYVKSYLPGQCPIDKTQLRRAGDYTCLTHAQVSATSAGKCPLGGEDLKKVEEVEKATGKKIDQLAKEAPEPKK